MAIDFEAQRLCPICGKPTFGSVVLHGDTRIRLCADCFEAVNEGRVEVRASDASYSGAEWRGTVKAIWARRWSPCHSDAFWAESEGKSDGRW